MAPYKRKAHVYRIYQTDEDGNVVDPDVWIDVARIDVFAVTFYGDTDVDGQRVTFYTDWRDDAPTVDERVYENLGVQNPDDETVSIKTPIIHRTRFVFPSTKSGVNNQEIKFTFRNDPGTDTKRVVHKVRVYNNDLKNEIDMPTVNVGDPQPKTAITGGPGLGKILYPITWDDYAAALRDGQQDASQYVDAEIVDAFTLRFPNSSFAGGSGAGQDVRFHLIQDGADPGTIGTETLFDPPPDDATGTVYRLDPLQMIVNVSWGGIAVEFFDGAT